MGNSVTQFTNSTSLWKTVRPPRPPDRQYGTHWTQDIFINPMQDADMDMDMDIDTDSPVPLEKNATYDRIPGDTHGRDAYEGYDRFPRGSIGDSSLATLRRMSMEDHTRRVEYVPEPIVGFESSDLTSNYDALHYLARCGRKGMFTGMWKNYKLTHDEGGLLHQVVKKNHYELLDALVKHRISLNALDPQGASALFYAVDGGHTECAKILLKNGAVTRITEDVEPGRTVLYTAAKRGNADVVNMTLDVGVPVDSVGKYDYTALHVAADSGHLEVVKVLLNRGASVDKLTLSDRTAFEVATHNKHMDVARAMIERGANINRFDDHGRSILHWAAGSPDPQIVSFLLDSGASVAIANRDGTMPHHVAARIGRSQNLHILLMRGAPLNAIRTAEYDGAQRTALVDAIDARRYQSSIVLLIHGAYPSSPDQYDTDLLYSVANVYAHDPRSFGGHLIEAILFSGHFISTKMAIKDVTNVMSLYAHLGAWYRQLLSQPLDLKNMCRILIRSRLIRNSRGISIWRAVHSLNAPECVQNFLLLKECDLDRITDYKL